MHCSRDIDAGVSIPTAWRWHVPTHSYFTPCTNISCFREIDVGVSISTAWRGHPPTHCFLGIRAFTAALPAMFWAPQTRITSVHFAFMAGHLRASLDETHSASSGSCSSPSTPHQMPRDTGTMNTRERPELLSVAILEDHCNDKKLDGGLITDYMVRSFRFRHDGMLTARSRDQHLQNLKNHYQTVPDFRMDFVNCSANVDEVSGVASVYMFFKLSGLLPDFRRESVAILRWEKRHGEWVCVKYEGVRGPAGLPDE